MGATNLAEVLNAPGRLCYTPTDLSTAFPHGGTAIGATKECVLTFVEGRKEIRDEAFGQEIKDIIWTGENVAIAFVLRQWDDDALGILFENTAAGTTSQHKVASGPGTIRPGALLSTRAKVVLFSPLDPERVPAVLLYKAIPMIRETADLALALDKRYETPCVFAALRDASDRVWKVGRLKDLAL